MSLSGGKRADSETFPKLGGEQAISLFEKRTERRKLSQLLTVAIHPLESAFFAFVEKVVSIPSNELVHFFDHRKNLVLVVEAKKCFFQPFY